MAKTKMRAKKGPFDDLDKEFKDAVDGMAADQVNARIKDVALAQADLDEAEKNDQDLKDKKDVVKQASQVYTEGKKFNKLRIRYLRKRLIDLGKK